MLFPRLFLYTSALIQGSLKNDFFSEDDMYESRNQEIRLYFINIKLKLILFLLTKSLFYIKFHLLGRLTYKRQFP